MGELEASRIVRRENSVTALASDIPSGSRGCSTWTEGAQNSLPPGYGHLFSVFSPRCSKPPHLILRTLTKRGAVIGLAHQIRRTPLPSFAHLMQIRDSSRRSR